MKYDIRIPMSSNPFSYLTPFGTLACLEYKIEILVICDEVFMARAKEEKKVQYFLT